MRPAAGSDSDLDDGDEDEDDDDDYGFDYLEPDSNSDSDSESGSGAGTVSCPRHESTDVHTFVEPIGVRTESEICQLRPEAVV